MSKSLKNFITIDDALEKYTARQIRFAFLLQNWNARFDFKEDSMREVRSAEGILNVSCHDRNVSFPLLIFAPILVELLRCSQGSRCRSK